jgi:hypothetical protein
MDSADGQEHLHLQTIQAEQGGGTIDVQREDDGGSGRAARVRAAHSVGAIRESRRKSRPGSFVVGPVTPGGARPAAPPREHSMRETERQSSQGQKQETG